MHINASCQTRFPKALRSGCQPIHSSVPSSSIQCRRQSGGLHLHVVSVVLLQVPATAHESVHGGRCYTQPARGCKARLRFHVCASRSTWAWTWTHVCRICLNGMRMLFSCRGSTRASAISVCGGVESEPRSLERRAGRRARAESAR